jgi:hypothetical protein
MLLFAMHIVKTGNYLDNSQTFALKIPASHGMLRKASA